MFLNESKNLKYKKILGSIVDVTMDRPIGYVHHGITYPVNYGYVEGIIGGDGEEQDVYLLGVKKPMKFYQGAKIIAIIHRINDNEDKWVACPKSMSFTKEEIIQQTAFMEQYFKSEIIM